jgi:hypothetical protein
MGGVKVEIVASARLEYCEGLSVAEWERLVLVVKFKQDGKLFKRKLTKTLVSTYQVENSHLSMRPLNSYDEYFAECEKYLNDQYLIKKAAENMIKKYFNEKSKNQLKVIFY